MIRSNRFGLFNEDNYTIQRNPGSYIISWRPYHFPPVYPRPANYYIVYENGQEIERIYYNIDPLTIEIRRDRNKNVNIVAVLEGSDRETHNYISVFVSAAIRFERGNEWYTLYWDIIPDPNVFDYIVVTRCNQPGRNCAGVANTMGRNIGQARVRDDWFPDYFKILVRYKDGRSEYITPLQYIE